MRKLVLLLLLLCLPLLACAEDAVIIHDKISNPADDFQFPEGTTLLEVYFPKIYDCDSALIRYGEYTMLLDAADLQWTEVARMMKTAGVDSLTYAFLSHPHTDHMYGFQYVLEGVPTGEFLHAFPEDYVYNVVPAPKVYAALHGWGIPFRMVQHGDKIDFGGVQMEVLQRYDEDISCNNASAMLRVSLKDRSVLFAADIQMDSQRAFAAQDVNITADVLKAPHHGYNRLQRVFVDAVDPALVIITSLPNTANTAQQMKDEKIAYRYTNRGILRLATDGNVWTLERLP